MPGDKPKAAPLTPGRFAYDGLERALHEKARLGIMTSLLARPAGLSFGDIKDVCGLTDGNLKRHLDVLVEAGFIRVEKDTKARRGRTMCYLTKLGQTRFLEYLRELERVVSDAAQATTSARKTSPRLSLE